MRQISILLFTFLLIALILPVNSETGIGSFGIASADICPAGVVIANSGLSQTVGGTNDHVTNYLRAKRFTVSVSQAMTVTALCVYATTVDPTNKNLRIGIYNDYSGTPSGGSLLLQSPEMTLMTGWNAVSIPGNINLPAGTYWFTIIGNGASTQTAVASGLSSDYFAVVSSYGSLPSTFPSGAYKPGTTYVILSAEVIGIQLPPGPDFGISSTPMSQSVGAGATATYTLTIQYGSSLAAGTQVNLAASGCPSSPASCSILPASVTDTLGGAGSDTATLSVITDISTSGVTPYSIMVIASVTSPVLSHQVAVQLTVSAPGTYPVVVHGGATQVVVTVTWGTPVPPMPSVYLQYSPGNYLAEAAGTVYDRLTCTSGASGCSTGTITNIHRVMFTLGPQSPTSTQTWTVLVSLSGTYTITVEVT